MSTIRGQPQADGLLYVPSQGGGSESYTDAEFSERYADGPQHDVLDGLIRSKLGEDCDDTHTPMLILLSKAAQEARGKRYGWAGARDKVRQAAEKSYERRGKRLSRRDFNGAVRWAIDQALAMTEEQCYEAWQNTPSPEETANGGGDLEKAVRRRLIEREAVKIVAGMEAQKLLDTAEDKSFDGLAFLESRQFGEPIWGNGSSVPWPKEQGFMLFGSDGTGKSTLMQQIVLARAGLNNRDVLGYPVTPDDRVTVYLALDRPAQIQESIARMVDLNDPMARDLLKRRFVFWRGGLPFQCDDDPKLFAQWCLNLGGDNVGLVIVDSVKDMVSNPSDNDAGMGFNAAMQHVIEAGVEFGCCHHNRKSTQQNAKPRQLADVFGSRFLTAGMGSVCNIWANDPTDSLRELTQLKAPYGSPIRAIEYRDDSHSGTSRSAPNWRDVLVTAIAVAGVAGLTDSELVSAVFGQNQRDAAYESNRARITRQFNRWIKDGSPYERLEVPRESKSYKVWRVASDDYPEPQPIHDSTSRAQAMKRDAEQRLANIDAQLVELDSEGD